MYRAVFISFLMLWASLEAAEFGSSPSPINGLPLKPHKEEEFNTTESGPKSESPFPGLEKRGIVKRATSLYQRVSALEARVNTLEKDYALVFPRKGTSDYVAVGGMPSLTAMTTCFWMATTDRANRGTPVAYASYATDNDLLVYDYKSFHLYIGGDSRATSVSANDGRWHHICATWENRAGSWKLYKDGYQRTSGRGFKIGHVIRASGTLVLGQEQDSVGGSFDSTQCFIGQISGVNIWNRVLSHSEIYRMSRSCLSGEGNVFKWAELKAHIHGGVRAIAPSSCRL